MDTFDLYAGMRERLRVARRRVDQWEAPIRDGDLDARNVWRGILYGGFDQLSAEFMVRWDASDPALDLKARRYRRPQNVEALLAQVTERNRGKMIGLIRADAETPRLNAETWVAAIDGRIGDILGEAEALLAPVEGDPLPGFKAGRDAEGRWEVQGRTVAEIGDGTALAAAMAALRDEVGKVLV